MKTPSSSKKSQVSKQILFFHSLMEKLCILCSRHNPVLILTWSVSEGGVFLVKWVAVHLFDLHRTSLQNKGTFLSRLRVDFCHSELVSACKRETSKEVVVVSAYL